MPKLDLALLLIFGTISLMGLLGAAWCFIKALRVAGEIEGDFKMFLWAVGVMIGLIISGMSGAYILIPIFLSLR